MSRVLYGASKNEFSLDVITNEFTDKMMGAASLYHIGSRSSEVVSWTNNAPKIKDLLELASLPDDVYVSFEYRVPHCNQRIDCILYGEGPDGRNNVFHIELKQWSNDSVQELYNTGVFEVEAYTGGHYKSVSHPSQQAAMYQQHLKNFVSVFNEDCNLHGCAYCYNYRSDRNPRSLYADHYKAILEAFPLYSGNQIRDLALRLNSLLNKGRGLDIFNKVQESPIRPSKNLLDAAANMFRGVTEFALLDDQLTASESIFAEIEKNRKASDKTVIIVKGGPGTGKTVIALNILAQLAQQGIYTNSFFTTRSKALRNSLKAKLSDIRVTNNKVTDAGDLIRNIFNFKPYSYSEGELDVLLVDEAHRIGRSSNHMTDKKYQTTHLSQVMSLIYCSRVCVFFIDDYQAITSLEIGTSDSIRDAAMHYKERLVDEEAAFRLHLSKLKNRLQKKNDVRNDLLNARSTMSSAEFTRYLTKFEKDIRDLKDDIAKENNISDVNSSFTGNINIVEFELKSQFRCNGSDNYLDWLDESIYRSYDRVQTTFDNEDYDFRIYPTPQSLYDAIKELDNPNSTPRQTARLVAGYCWDWKGKLTPEGDLEKEVVIGDFAMPWETLNRPRGIFRDKYASSADTWADEAAGINQIGCVFSIQGLELDYIGVILGPDIDYDSENDCLKAIPGITHNMQAGDNPDTYVKNIYRVLMSRGKKGCFIFSCNPGVSDFFRRCFEKRSSV